MGVFSLSTKSEALLWLHSSEIALIVFAAVVGIGLVGEIAFETDELPMRPDTRTYDARLRRKHRYRFAEVLVAIGVMGELIADAGIYLSSGRLQTISDHEVAALDRQTEDLRRANLALKALVQGRRISPEYEVLIREAMLCCAQQKFRMSIPAGDGEAALLAFQLSMILKDAQWDDGDLKIEQRPPGGPLVVGVRFLPDPDGAEAANNLDGWLHVAG